MLICSMALIISSVFSDADSVLAGVPIVKVVLVTGSVVIGGSVGAKVVARVEGTVVETMGITVYGVVANSLCLD